MARTDKLWQDAAQALRPPERVPLSQWLEANLRLPQGLSAEPGPIKLWPYQRGIADAIGDPKVERVTLVKPVRVGFTTLLTGVLAHHVVNDPAPVLCVLPTESDCRDAMVSDIEPTFDASPFLRGILLEPGRTDSGRNTILHRMFPGGSLKIVAAKAPRNLRRHSARVLMVDEADACEAGAEGNPIALAEKRTLSFANRKLIVGSTPLLEDTSHVLRLYEQSDARVFEVPCPDCGAFTEILWRHIEFEPLGFRCPHCEALIDESHKPEMVEAGQWRATKPEVESHAGFRLNALVSLLPNASWSKLVAEFRQAKDDSADLQVFVNTVLGQGWRELADEADEADLASRAEPISLDAIPPDVLALTVGVDCQDDRLEASVFGWSKDGTAFVLDHRSIYGSPDDDETWGELDELLRSRWSASPRPGMLKVDAACIDAGDGGHFDKVCSFCQPRLSRRVFAIKGVAGPGRASIERSRSKRRVLHIVGVDSIKATIIAKLARGRSIRFSDQLDESYFTQLTSERRIVRYSRGRPVVRFERIPGRRAEALDAAVYAFAARAALRLNLDQRETDLASPTPPTPPPQRRVVGEFMQRGRGL